MAKFTKFVLLQASVVFNRQISIFETKYDDTKEGRNKAFRNTIQKLEERKIIKINPKRAEYILVYKAKITDNIIYCQLAKRTQMDTYTLNRDNMIEQQSIDSYPPLDVFIHLAQQQFAVELNTSILDASAIETNIKNLINSLQKEFSIFINTIQDRKEFWDLISNDDSIQEVSFDLVVPNFFNATGAANDLVSNAKESVNADSVGLTLKNKNGGLKVSLSAIDSYVKYSSATGSWKLKIKQKGQTKYIVIHSTDYCKKKEVESEIIDLIKKWENNLNVDPQMYNALIENLIGLFDYEE